MTIFLSNNLKNNKYYILKKINLNGGKYKY